MQHVYDLAEADPAGPTIVAVGVFDGVHRGHQHLLHELVETARAQDCIPAALTFFPHPDIVLGQASGRYYLTTPEQRAAMFRELGVQVVVSHPFNDAVRKMRAADFVDRLLAYLNLRELWVGADFALGHRREGDVDFLRAQGAAKGFTLRVVDLVTNDDSGQTISSSGIRHALHAGKVEQAAHWLGRPYCLAGDVDFLRAQGAAKGFTLRVVDLVTNDDSGQTISSSGIRHALHAGKVEQAAHWLGRPYCLAGDVVRGDGRGHSIGFPTANMDVWDQQILPRKGVYAGWARLGGRVYEAVANLGRRPTFDGQIVRMEAHLLDFDQTIYGEPLAFDFVARLRDEMRFDGIDELVAQIGRDVARGRAILAEQPRPPDARWSG